MEYPFSVEIHAPKGLGKIEEHLGECRLKLSVYKSGYNGKAILRSNHGEEVEWAMDSSDSSILFAFGYIQGNVDYVDLLLGDLSIALVASGYPHQIEFDDEKNQNTNTSSFLWSEYENS